MGSIFLLTSMISLLNPNSVITDNGVMRKTLFSDDAPFIIVGLILLFFHLKVGRRVVRMKVDLNCLEFKFDGEQIIKKWNEVESIKRYWMIAPPFYSVKFENDERPYYFNSGWFYIALPFYVFDLSEMGEFINNRKKDIQTLKELKDR